MQAVLNANLIFYRDRHTIRKMAKLFLPRSRLISLIIPRYNYSTVPKSESTVKLSDEEFVTDAFTNITPKISSYLGQNLHLQKHNPLSLVRQRIVKYFYSSFTRCGNPIFSVYDNLSPIVTTKQNFDDLLIPSDHPSRAKSDCYYVNKGTLLRAHMTAHQSELLNSGLDNFLMIGDVYRRDEIDSTHFPVFHQVSIFFIKYLKRNIFSSPVLVLRLYKTEQRYTKRHK